MFKIEIFDGFHAAHFLKLHDDSWEDYHEHDWKVSVEMQSSGLDRIGVVADFEALKPVLKKILGEFEGKSFNEHSGFKNPWVNTSTENIAKLIYDKLAANFKCENARITRVTVWETPEGNASFCP